MREERFGVAGSEGGELKLRKIKLYLRSLRFQRNVAVSLLAVTLLVITGIEAKRSLARALYRGMVIAYQTTSEEEID